MSAETKYTPGPWTVDEDGFVYDASAFHETPICDPRCFDANIAGNMAEMDANARLIASAPELLEAGQQLLAALVHNAGKQGVVMLASQQIRQLRAAIAQATGGQGG